MYQAPVADIAFTLKNSAGFAAAQAEGIYPDLADDLLEAVLEEAGKFASDVIAPLNRVGDQQGALVRNLQRARRSLRGAPYPVSTVLVCSTCGGPAKQCATSARQAFQSSLP